MWLTVVGGTLDSANLAIYRLIVIQWHIQPVTQRLLKISVFDNFRLDRNLFNILAINAEFFYSAYVVITLQYSTKFSSEKTKTEITSSIIIIFFHMAKVISNSKSDWLDGNNAHWEVARNSSSEKLSMHGTATKSNIIRNSFLLKSELHFIGIEFRKSGHVYICLPCCTRAAFIITWLWCVGKTRRTSNNLNSFLISNNTKMARCWLTVRWKKMHSHWLV